MLGNDIVFNFRMYPKYEKPISDCSLYILVDESLRDLIQTTETAAFAPRFTDDAFNISDDMVLYSYEPYEIIPNHTIGRGFYSIPLVELSKDEMVAKIKEGLYLCIIKNNKIGSPQKVIYDGIVLSQEGDLDPLGSPESLIRMIPQ